MLPETFWVGTLGSLVFGLLGLIMVILGFKMFDWITPKLDLEAELMKGNKAVAIVVSVVILSIAYIVASVVH